MKRFTHIFLVGLLVACATSTRGESVEWIRQLGTTGWDESRGASADGLGNVYLSGFTSGSLGSLNAGGLDAFVSKYDVAGNHLWTRQLGTAGWDVSHSVSADGLGNVYISGGTLGILGGLKAGGEDAFVSKYDNAGILLWTRQLGTRSDDWGNGVSADGLGNVYISGSTYGSLGGPHAGSIDAFVSKYSAAGSLLWTRQFGTTNDDFSTGISADGLGNVYISGSTNGSLGGLNAGGYDTFVSKYDAAGSLLWTRQLGTTTADFGWDVTADGLGNVYFSGYTGGNLGGPNTGEFDAFVAKIADGVVPEPSSFALSMVGVLGLFVGGRRRWGKTLTAR